MLAPLASHLFTYSPSSKVNKDEKITGSHFLYEYKHILRR